MNRAARAFYSCVTMYGGNDRAARRGWRTAACVVVWVACVTPATAWGAGARSAQECADADVEPSAETFPRVEAAMLCLINDERARARLVPLRLDARLARSARFHTRDMISNHRFAHQLPGRPSLLTRILRTGYFAGVRDGLFTENIGYGPQPAWTAAILVWAWMESPTHRANILDRDFRDIGIGSAMVGPDPGFHRTRPSAVYTTDFGRRYMPPRRRRRCRVVRRGVRRYCVRRRASSSSLGERGR
jgi:uncharacterized protein YkwD